MQKNVCIVQLKTNGKKSESMQFFTFSLFSFSFSCYSADSIYLKPLREKSNKNANFIKIVVDDHPTIEASFFYY